MPSNKRQRELARARAERQAARRAAERAAQRKRRTVMTVSIGATVLAVAALFLVVNNLRGDGKDKVEPAASESATTEPTPTGPCQVVADPAEKSGDKKPGLPPDPAFGATKTVKGNLELNKGAVELTLFADKAPCTVNSFKHLASTKYFDGTKCHRQTNSQGLVVLQCGDPTGTGSGGPGYRFKDENLPKPADAATGTAKYPRGTVAMANAGAGTNGSQFFLVMKDSTLPPNYTIFGQITKGMEILDAIQKVGIKDGQEDGPPAEEVTIKSFTIT